MDWIKIDNLDIYAYHGVFPEETRLGQKFIISIALQVNTRAAGVKDDLNLSVSYADVAKAVVAWFIESPYALIESCAEMLARKILLSWHRVELVQVCVKKPWAPIGLPLETVSVSVERAWHKAFIALGANIGETEKTLTAAIADMACEELQVLKQSTFIKTKAVGYTDQADFLNGVVAVKTLYEADELLAILHMIEAKYGRTREVHWGPRTLDLDLLLYDNLITEEEPLVLPHPRMLERTFVLLPMCEIAPYAVHPLTKQRMVDALQALNGSEAK